MNGFMYSYSHILGHIRRHALMMFCTAVRVVLKMGFKAF